MKQPIFEGSGTALVTPFKDGVIDFRKMAELIDFQLCSGTAAIIVCGTTGENATMSIAEQESLIEFCVKHVGDRNMKVVAGIGGNDTVKALKLAKSAEKAGADGFLMVTPYYNKTSQKGLIEHFTYVADRTEKPLILYNVPGRTGIGIALETYRELSKHPNINGVKEASGSVSLAAQTLAACGDELNVWSGNDEDTVPMMALGAKGVISVASNIVPDVIANLCDLCLNEEFSDAAQLYFKYADLFAKLFVEVNPMPVKTAMGWLGLCSGEVRLPLTDMSEQSQEKLRISLRKAGLMA